MEVYYSSNTITSPVETYERTDKCGLLTLTVLVTTIDALQHFETG